MYLHAKKYILNVCQLFYHKQDAKMQQAFRVQKERFDVSQLTQQSRDSRIVKKHIPPGTAHMATKAQKKHTATTMELGGIKKVDVNSKDMEKQQLDLVVGMLNVNNANKHKVASGQTNPGSLQEQFRQKLILGGVLN